MSTRPDQYQPTPRELIHAEYMAAGLGLLSPSEQWAQARLTEEASATVRSAQEAGVGLDAALDHQRRVTEIERLVYRHETDNGRWIGYQLDGILPAGTVIPEGPSLRVDTPLSLRAEVSSFSFDASSSIKYTGGFGLRDHNIAVGNRYGNLLRERGLLALSAPSEVRMPPPIKRRK